MADYDKERAAAYAATHPVAPLATTANSKQIGGDHYKQFKIQPWDAIIDWKLGYLDGTAVKYLARWRHKGGREDLLKAKHFIEKQLEQLPPEGS